MGPLVPRLNKIAKKKSRELTEPEPSSSVMKTLKSWSDGFKSLGASKAKKEQFFTARIVPSGPQSAGSPDRSPSDAGSSSQAAAAEDVVVLTVLEQLQGKAQGAAEEPGRDDLLDLLRQMDSATKKSVSPGNSSNLGTPPTSRSPQASPPKKQRRLKLRLWGRWKGGNLKSRELPRELPTAKSDGVLVEERGRKVTYSGAVDVFYSSLLSFLDSQQLHYSRDLPPPPVPRRTALPDPAEPDRGISIWGFLKNCFGKDLVKISTPISFNEPLSIMQKYCEMVEYSYLLDTAYEFGVIGRPDLRVLHVATFIVSRFCGNAGRTHKPFNPLMGETFEGVFPERGMRFLAESVEHHPPTMAFLAEGRGWRLRGDVVFKVAFKFWEGALHMDPQGTLLLEFDDGETFTWKNIIMIVENLIFGRPFVDLMGDMHVTGNRGYSAFLTFRENNVVDKKNPHLAKGYTSDPNGKILASISGHWHRSLFYVEGDVAEKAPGRLPHELPEAKQLWQGIAPSTHARQYKFTPFCLQLNEITPDIVDLLPPTDSRLRPDQRALEDGRQELAHSEKMRVEQKQRVALRNHDARWRARWFRRSDDGCWHYSGGYWEAREKREWADVYDIFGQDE